MGSKANPTVIGAFVVGAVALVVVGVLLFGGGKFFQEKELYVIFFDSSVQGLSVGAPVVFRGVQVGQVAKVEALYDPKKTTIHVKVIVELVPGSVRVAEGVKRVKRGSPQEALELLVQQGLRASLQMQGFVTGLLLVSLDFYPDTPIKRLGLDPTYPELPTVPTEVERLLDNVRQAMAELGKLPLEALLSEVLGMLKRVNTLLEVPELKQALMSLNDLVTAAQQLLKDIDGQVAPLASSAKETLTTARGTLGQAQKSLSTLTDAATPAMKQGEEAMGSVASLTRSDSVMLNDLEHTLKAIEEAARSIRILADSLQRNPEALLRGKGR
jgi:paraquat-inducible protein B